VSAREFRTARVTEAEVRAFRRKAEQFMQSARDALERRNWDAAGHNAIHAVISANDALLGAKHGIRPAGKDHKDAATLLARKDPTDEARKNATRLLRLVNKKNLVQYEGRVLSETEARALVTEASRFFEWARSRLSS
jgi:HEPN domain-containing protein